MKFTQRISEINQLMTNNQHVLDALRSVIGRFTYIKIKVLIHTVVNVIRKMQQQIRAREQCISMIKNI